MFVLVGSKELIVATDHTTLLGIFINQDLSNIPNPHILPLTEKKPFCYLFRTVCSLGKLQQGADEVSRNPIRPVLGPTTALRQQSSKEDIAFTENIYRGIYIPINNLIFADSVQ